MFLFHTNQSKTVLVLCISYQSINHIKFQQSTIGTNIVAAVVAVITLHLALGLFIYKVDYKVGYRMLISTLSW